MLRLDYNWKGVSEIHAFKQLVIRHMSNKIANHKYSSVSCNDKAAAKGRGS